MAAWITLIDPKFPHNVGGAIRAASALGAERVSWTGTRIEEALGAKARLPREERMKGFAKVRWEQRDDPLEESGELTPVCVEVAANAEQLHHFVHPNDAMYVFGPEDGGVPQDIRAQCHRFVMIPTFHCVNLAAAVYLTLYDRRVKRLAAGAEREVATRDLLHEARGWIEHPDMTG